MPTNKKTTQGKESFDISLIQSVIMQVGGLISLLSIDVHS
jgi:hypothetical protein